MKICDQQCFAESMALSNAPNVTNALRFTPEGSFKISLFSDLHYGECN